MNKHIALLTNYPTFDNANWKIALVKSLIQQGFQISIFYGKSGITSQFRAVLTKIKKNKIAVAASTKRGNKKLFSNISEFKKLGIPVYKFNNLNQESVAKFIHSQGVEVCVCALDQILIKGFIANSPKLLNVHYGKLPMVKGASAAEWTLVKNHGVLEITLHEIDQGVDTGKIISVHKINIFGVNSLAELRNRIQENIPKIYFEYFVGISDVQTEIVNCDGKLYTFMHKELLAILENKLNNENTINA